MHGAGALIARQKHAAKHVAHGSQWLRIWLVEERRHLLDVACHQQEALAALRQAAQGAAVVRRLGHRVAVRAQQIADLIEKMTAARSDARHVLEQHQLGRIVAPGFQHEPDATDGEAVERLVLVGLALALSQQAGKALARRGQKDDVRPLATGGALDVLRRGLTPVSGRLGAMEGAVLVGVEQIEHGARHASQAPEVAHAGRININAPDAAEVGAHVADARARLVEALGASTKASEQVEMANLAAVRHGRTPASLPRPCGAMLDAQSTRGELKPRRS